MKCIQMIYELPECSLTWTQMYLEYEKWIQLQKMKFSVHVKKQTKQKKVASFDSVNRRKKKKLKNFNLMTTCFKH